MVTGSRRFILPLIGALILLPACASGPQRDENGVKGKLFTQTLAGDIRLFRFVVELPEPPLRPITQRSPQGQRPNARGTRDNEELLDQVERSLARQPELQQFCPNGYTVIERYAILNELVIRGECQYDDKLSPAR